MKIHRLRGSLAADDCPRDAHYDTIAIIIVLKRTRRYTPPERGREREKRALARIFRIFLYKSYLRAVSAVITKAHLYIDS